MLYKEEKGSCILPGTGWLFSLRQSYAQNTAHGCFFAEVLFILAQAALGQGSKAEVCLSVWEVGKGRDAKGRTEQSMLLRPRTHVV